MDVPAAEIEGCRLAHERMADVLAGVVDDVARRPSSLPGWTVGHVLSHLARNAESMHRRVEAAARGEIVDQYVGGAAGRAAEIEAGATRSAEDLIDDVIAWSRRVDAAFASFPDDRWGRPVRSVDDEEHPVAQLPLRRWREVELHLVDLGIGFSPADWSDGLVERMVPGLIAGLADRSDARSLMAWATGRGAPPDLRPWG